MNIGKGPNWRRQVPAVPYLKKENIPSVIPIDVGRQLFVDDFLIQETDLKRKFHQPERYEGNPILKAETAIEMHGGIEPMAAMISDGFCWDPIEKHFKLWYEAGWRDGTMMATSLDGIHFTRPNLDVEPGSNRILPKRKKMVRHGTGIAIDPYTKDASQRFKMTIYENDSGKAWAYTSPDGIHWDNRGEISECGDNTTIFYNPFRKKWVYSIRKDFFGRARFYREHDDFVAGKNWVEWKELEKDRKSGANAIKTSDAEVFWAHADDLDLPDPEVIATNARLKADPNVPKARAKPRADGTPNYFPFDDTETQLYNLDAVAYESIMLGVFSIHRGPNNGICSELLKRPKACDLQLAYSRDGFHWDRPDRTDFLAGTRQEGSWDRAYLHAGVGICAVMGDKLYFYYSGWSGVSPALTNDWYAGGATGIAMLRRDGFASMNAGAAGGTLTTRPVKFKGRHLFVNVNAPKGELTVEVLDEKGNVIAPFSTKNCIAITGDKTLQQVTWKGTKDLAGLSGQKVQFRFRLKQGELYSFWVSPDLSGASHGYVAAGGPGFDGPMDTAGSK